MVRCAVYFQLVGVVSWESGRGYVALVLIMCTSKWCVGGTPRIYTPLSSYWVSIPALDS